MRLALLVLLVLLVVTAGTVAAVDASPRPSDTNNQPANATTAPPSANPPAPGATTPNPSPPAPAPSTPAPTNATSAPAPTSASNATSSNNASAAPTPTPTPTLTPLPTEAAATDASSSSPSSSSSSSSGMGAGAIVGIVLACVGLVGIIGFFAYRHFRARREDAEHGFGPDAEYGGASPVLESAHDAKMYASLDMPKHSRQTTSATATPTDDIVVMTKYATPSSPKFADNPPQLSPPPGSSFHHHHDAVADFTKSATNFDQSRGPGAAAASTEFAHSYREGSYAESYAESYAGGTSYGGGSFMNSFDHGMLGRETFRDTLTDEENATPAKAKAAPSNGLAGLDTGKDDSHWMDAMDEMRDTNDSYAMLEAGGSYNSRGSAMRFSTESDIRG